jgi:potassium-dependent mechanosensitive channel
MKMRRLLLPVILFTTFVLSHHLMAQEEASRVKPDSVVLKPFSSIGITQEFGATNRLITEAEKAHLTVEVLSGFRSESDSLASHIRGFLSDTTTMTLEDVTSRELDQIVQRAQFHINHVEGQQDRLSKEANALEREMMLLQNNSQRWTLTLDQESNNQALESRLTRIERTIQGVDSLRHLLQKDMMVILEMQDNLAEEKTALDEVVSRVKAQQVVLGETLLNRDVPGFFKDLGNLHKSGLVRLHMQEFKESVLTDIALVRSGYMRSMVLSLLMLLALLSLSIWLKDNQVRWISEEHSELSALHRAFILSPVASSLFLGALLIRLLIPDLPETFYAINLMLMMVPMAILMVRIYGSVFRTWILVLLIATGINLLYELSYHPGVLIRILLMGVSVIGIWLFTWVYIKKPFEGLIKHRLIHKLFRVLLLVFLVMQFLAIIANLLGAFRLAEFFALIPLQITLLALAIQLTTKLAHTMLFLILSGSYMQKLNIVREEFQVIYRKGTWLIDFLLLLLFLSIGLQILRIKDLVFDWGRGVLNDGRHIGAIEITLGSILIFVFVIWLSIMISRIISHVLEKDVFTRVSTAKGVPGTVLLLLKIALISAGFFLAAGASGMQLTNLSIVLGAFSVGIGFGLQNIFNNMVSGLILAFERPINVGDVVQVGELVGTVKTIGLRASTVKSFDGAEVIVPNGNLISNEMINWTLSDTFRRMDLRVGVAYGTDPERVLDLMKKIAEEHVSVRKKPVPKAYFIEFGDSSLNFRLLAWVKLDNRLEVESEINVLINKKLAEEGIEIPFPQTDLHIRSDATKAKLVSKPTAGK